MYQHYDNTSEDDDDDDQFAVILGPDECDRLCNEFAEVTNTNTAFGMMHLQQNKWNLEAAVNAFYQQPMVPVKKVVAVPKQSNNVADSQSNSASSVARPPSSLKQAKRIKVLSWNTDGIDDSEPKSRASCVSKIILSEDPDIVLLQEVTSTTVAIYDRKISDDYVIHYADFGASLGYFTAIAAKKGSCVVESNRFKPFNTSNMGRGLQSVEAQIHGVNITLMTSHLESMKNYENERKRQLLQVFNSAKDVDVSRIVLVGGDFNLREKELKDIGGAPKKFQDAWEAAGRRDIARWTWDMSRNDNHGALPGPNKNIRARFDRLYFRSADDVILKPVYFELVGLEKISPLRRFPSDHWGILFHADLSPLATAVA